jgi:hypothetical protein
VPLTTWRHIIYVSHMTHVVPVELYTQLVADMAVRGAVPAAAHGLGPNPSATTEWWLDLGGAVHVRRPIEHVDLDGLRIGIGCGHVRGVLSRLAALPHRHFADGTAYRKLKLWRFATVLTPDQAAALELALRVLLPGAEERHEAFEAAVRRGDRHGVS